MPSLFVLGSSSAASELLPMPFEKEAHLQHIIASSPRVLDSALTNDTRWKLVAREFKVPGSSGKHSLDAVFINQDGIPVLAEVKRASDPRIRRAIFGQLLEYIDCFVRHVSGDLLKQTFEQSCRVRQADPEAELDDLLLGENPEPFWDQVQANLQQERLHIAVIADDVSSSLVNIIARLNKNWPAATFSAIEVKQYASKDGTTRVVLSADRAEEAVTFPVPQRSSEVAGSSSSAAKSTGQPSSWNDAAAYLQNPEMREILLKEAQSNRGSVGLRKIYYDLDDVMRWRLKIQKNDVNMYQQMRFADDLQQWKKLFPEFGNEIRTPEEARALSFNLKTPDQLRRLLEFVATAKSTPNTVRFLPRGTIGEQAQ